MSVNQRTHSLKLITVAFGVVFIALLACARTVGPAQAPWNVSQTTPSTPTEPIRSPQITSMPTARAPGTPVVRPTPDSPHRLQPLRTEVEEYYVQAGDTLNKIAQRYGVNLNNVVEANDISNPNYLEIGQYLVIPPPVPVGTGPDFKVIPDSELVYGPSSMDFDIEGFIRQRGGYLASYTEEVDGFTVSGAQIVKRISGEFSVNPRLLLAVLEFRSGWITNSNPSKETLDFPMGVFDSWREGLYRQLAWTADNLNRGYYLWRVSGVSNWIVDGGVILPAVTINAGTAAVQHLFSQLYDRTSWERAVSSEGVFAVYYDLFGYPFDYTYEPIVPSNLSQPAMTLPFEPGYLWAFTGGPHGGWGDGSAWAAIDFAPPGESLGCFQSDAWVVAAADGPIIRSEFGAVVQDIDFGGSPSDGLEGTGWTLLYMHIESRDRVQPGTYLHAGDKIGHPSCEGGVSTGTHLHLARRFNGEWIPADQTLPFILDGWVSRGSGSVYNGYLEKDGNVVEAWEGRTAVNGISR